MEFSLDFKGGKCYKVESNKPKTSQSSNNSNTLLSSAPAGSSKSTLASSSASSPAVASSSKDSNNNVKEKFKENAEISDMVGSKNAFIVCFFLLFFITKIWKNLNIEK